MSALREANRRLFHGPFGRVYSSYMDRRRPRARDRPRRVGWRCSSNVRQQRVRYLAIDISPAMVRRARRKAHGLDQVEVIERIPVPDGSVDLFLSMWGLHCLPHPAKAVHEAARCLKPGGRLLGAMICTGDGLRLLVRPSAGAFAYFTPASHRYKPGHRRPSDSRRLRPHRGAGLVPRHDPADRSGACRAAGGGDR